MAVGEGAVGIAARPGVAEPLDSPMFQLRHAARVRDDGAAVIAAARRSGLARFARERIGKIEPSPCNDRFAVGRMHLLVGFAVEDDRARAVSDSDLRDAPSSNLPLMATKAEAPSVATP